MPLSDPLLWSRLQGMSIGPDEAALPFVDRLARDNAWSLGLATRVVEEYRRFLYLAYVADHPVTPSDAVDQAWHLHLTYTRSYWDDLCAHVLGRPLHHGPTSGGPDERRRYDAQYRATLRSYEHEFGEPPPADIWPDAATRFGRHYVRIDRDAVWLIDRRSWQHGLQVTLAGGVLCFGLAACTDLVAHVHSMTMHDAIVGGLIVSLVLLAVRARHWRPAKRRRRKDGGCGSGCGALGCGSGGGDSGCGSGCD